MATRLLRPTRGRCSSVPPSRKPSPPAVRNRDGLSASTDSRLGGSVTRVGPAASVVRLKWWLECVGGTGAEPCFLFSGGTGAAAQLLRVGRQVQGAELWKELGLSSVAVQLLPELLFEVRARPPQHLDSSSQGRDRGSKRCEVASLTLQGFGGEDAACRLTLNSTLVAGGEEAIPLQAEDMIAVVQSKSATAPASQSETEAASDETVIKFRVCCSSHNGEGILLAGARVADELPQSAPLLGHPEVAEEPISRGTDRLTPLGAPRKPNEAQEEEGSVADELLDVAALLSHSYHAGTAAEGIGTSVEGQKVPSSFEERAGQSLRTVELGDSVPTTGTDTLEDGKDAEVRRRLKRELEDQGGGEEQAREKEREHELEARVPVMTIALHSLPAPFSLTCISSRDLRPQELEQLPLAKRTLEASCAQADLRVGRFRGSGATSPSSIPAGFWEALLPDEDLRSFVREEHFEVFLDEVLGCVCVKDLAGCTSSASSTLVNGVPAPPGQKVRLFSGDVLGLCASAPGGAAESSGSSGGTEEETELQLCTRLPATPLLEFRLGGEASGEERRGNGSRAAGQRREATMTKEDGPERGRECSRGTSAVLARTGAGGLEAASPLLTRLLLGVLSC